ncbi:MAG: calcium-translocating P-type ATPase, PMCA-type [Syntrophomonadaceae bacterium]|nr:calcium-translocating P-type ATPase, PMCA-type [Syntrophomonadaceae bacterium]
MIPHSTSHDDVLRELQVDPLKGLTSEEALLRLQEYGENRLEAKKKKSMIQRFFEQFKDAMIVILLIAAAISFVVAIYEGEGYFEPVLILIIVVLNAIMGVVQESKAEKALEALQQMSAPQARVRRDGTESVIEAVQLVPGDIIILEAGDFVPADGRLIESASLKSEEAALTGESVPSEKQAEAAVKAGAPLGDRFNMVYSGCSITYGRGLVVVTATGMKTEMGKIADLLAAEEDGQTPLQQRLAVLGKYLGIMALVVCAVIFAIGLAADMRVMEIFMIAIALAVSAIPEGLPAIVTIVLAVGVQRMVRKNAIIRRLPAVETLGSASVICSDKTGTLTLNQMTLVKAFDAASGVLEDTGEDNSPVIRQLLTYAVLCSDGRVEFENGEARHIGDPTETAIVLAGHNNGLPQDELNHRYPRLAELPFDSDRKLMSTVNRVEDRTVVIVKGAFDVLEGRCVAGDLEAGRRSGDSMSRDALRVLAVAYKEIGELPDPVTSDELEKDLTFMGLLGMIDPPRPEARDAVAVCKQAGIRPVMITGDHVITASAIARDLGIMSPGDQAVTGSDLINMSAEDLGERVRGISVYARVSPEDKIRIVRAWQRQGEVVSMTGDGVNDAPALKAADIGCAMGITGTDVAKGAADMVLTDDNFATIVDAVREGRGIYDNIKKAVAFLLGTNIGEVLTVFTAMVIWNQSPLLAVQLLWINLVTDSLPAIALGMEAVEPDVMKHKPKPKDESIFAHGLGLRIALQGAMFAVLTLIAFWIGWQESGDIDAGRTMAFLVLALTQVVHSFNMRSNHSLFKTGFFSNRYLTGAALISAILVITVVLIPPVANAFGMVGLTSDLYLLALALALVPLLILEISKAFGLIKHHSAE